MAQVQMPNKVCHERSALLDRIQCFEVAAQWSRDDRLPVAVDVIRADLACANARLDQIHYMIACLRVSTCASETEKHKKWIPAQSR